MLTSKISFTGLICQMSVLYSPTSKLRIGIIILETSKHGKQRIVINRILINEIILPNAITHLINFISLATHFWHFSFFHFFRKTSDRLTFDNITWKLHFHQFSQILEFLAYIRIRDTIQLFLKNVPICQIHLCIKKFD